MKKHQWHANIWLVLYFISTACGSSLAADEPLNTSICALSKSEEGRIVRNVHVEAVYITDLMHVGVLKDSNCQNVNVGIRFYEDNGAAENSWDSVVMSDLMSAKHRWFDVSVTGDYLRRRGGRDLFVIKIVDRIAWRSNPHL